MTFCLFDLTPCPYNNRTQLMDELSPLLKELTAHPVSFLGGFVSGVLHLNLADDPVRSWLDQQSGSSSNPPSPGNGSGSNGSGPQTINID